MTKLACLVLPAECWRPACARRSPLHRAVDPLHRPFDTILDIYVRDGLVYYRALKLERPRFDQYVQSLAEAQVPAGDRNRQLAFWVNAYNAFVLRTVIDQLSDRGPGGQCIRATASGRFPGRSRSGRSAPPAARVTLDQIEKDIIVPLGDARALLALGRGALGGGRLTQRGLHGRADRRAARGRSRARRWTGASWCSWIAPTAS